MTWCDMFNQINTTISVKATQLRQAGKPWSQGHWFVDLVALFVVIAFLYSSDGSLLSPKWGGIVKGMSDKESTGQIQFQEVTDLAGFSYVEQSWGASWGNFNDDGLPDLWVGNHGAPPALYLNQGDGTFKDIAPLVYSASPNADTHGSAWADFDNDGDQDIIEQVGADHGIGEGRNHVFVNTGGILVERAVELGLDDPLGRGRTPLWFDWSGDGLLDVLLNNIRREDVLAPTLPFLQVATGFEAVSVGFENPKSSEFAQLVDLSGDGKLDLIIHGQKYPQRVYDIGSIPFRDITNTLGLATTDKTKDVVIGDFNGDLQSDLYIIRYNNMSDLAQVDNNIVLTYLFLNQEEQSITFQTTGSVFFSLSEWRLDQSIIYIGAEGYHPPTCCSFSLSPQDPNVSGIYPHVPGSDPGVYIGYDSGSESWQLSFSYPGEYAVVAAAILSNAPIYNLTPIGFDPQDRSLYNRMLVYDSDTFDDQTIEAGLYSLTDCVSGVAGDFDNDMDVDIYLVCSRPVENHPNILYENLGKGTFIAVPDAGGASGSLLGSGESVVVADYDNDGFLDLFVTNGDAPRPFPNGPDQLFRNLGNGNHWLEIDLVGTVSNRDGIGARILATVGSVTQLREQGGGMHNRAQNHQRIHFGLGSNTQVKHLLIQWPSGLEQEFFNIPADQLLQIVEPLVIINPQGYIPLLFK